MGVWVTASSVVDLSRREKASRRPHCMYVCMYVGMFYVCKSHIASCFLREGFKDACMQTHTKMIFLQTLWLPCLPESLFARKGLKNAHTHTHTHTHTNHMCAENDFHTYILSGSRAFQNHYLRGNEKKRMVFCLSNTRSQYTDRQTHEKRIHRHTKNAHRNTWQTHLSG